MNRKKPSKVVEFLNGKGFYIILILCIAAVGISGYVLFFHGDRSEDDFLKSYPSPSPIVSPSARPSAAPSSVPSETPSGVVREPDVTVSVPSPTIPSVDVPSSSDDGSGAVEVAGNANLENDTSPTPTASFYVWPVNGEVQMPFSVDELVFSNTMEDWRVHTGIDIAGSLGALVNAIGSGVVEDVYEDEMMGMTVVIDHGNSTRSVYKNLADTLKVSIGDIVTVGDTIGAIGSSADAESADTPHLHLEVIRSGAQIDPLDLLP